jgi:GH15 family glucan-1,4-alpha-glucosidase
MPSRIEDYAMIGDCHTAALVARDGSIDWLCFPRFDSPACFAALLGTEEHGRWLIAPAEPVKEVRRRYRPGTLILETDFETESGAVVRLIDFMPPNDGAVDIVRIVEGIRGQVKMRMELIVRFDYGWIVPWVRRTHDGCGIRAIAGPDSIYLRTSSVQLHGENLRTLGDFAVRAGERVNFDLVWHPSHDHHPPFRPDCEKALTNTEAFWQKWSDRCTYHSEWEEPVRRSLITLKALTYHPTGGVVAAATTSLPELIGGVRNWDYRICWLRDATFTLYALMMGGYTEEANAWRGWLVNAIAGNPSELQIMYGLRGERRLTELEVDWLPGFENSRPVRIGNAAYRQRQLDVYGEVMDALYVANHMGVQTPPEEVWRLQRAMVISLEKEWRKPDEGIWEVRGPPQHFTHSKVMAWVAFDRAVKSIEAMGKDHDAGRWRKARDEIHAQVMAEGFDPKVNSFVQYYGSNEPDASLLMLPLVGFIPARDPKMLGTVDYIRRTLARDGFIERYRTHTEVDGLPGREGVFLMCSFWLADNLAMQGKLPEAREIFERLLLLRNDVGLLSEQYDPKSKRLLGNFPQAFSHVGLINTACNLTGDGPARDRPAR